MSKAKKIIEMVKKSTLSEKNWKLDQVTSANDFVSNAINNSSAFIKHGFKGEMDDRGQGKVNYKGFNLSFVSEGENLHITLPSLKVKNNPDGFVKAVKALLDEVNKIS